MPPRIFISYSHDTNTHVERVLSLADRLRDEGLDVRLDQYLDNPPEGWTRWMQRQLEEAEFVLFVCSATYRARFDGKSPAGTGQGATWEGFLATQLLYDASSLNTRFVPVFFEDSSPDDIPLPLRPTTRYRLPSGYDDLYRRLTGQPKTPPPPIGAIRPMPPANRPRLTSSPVSSGQTIQNQGAAIGQQINVAGLATFHAPLVAPAPAPAPPLRPATILLVTANAADPYPLLALDTEHRAILDALTRARLRERYELRCSPAVTFPRLIHDLDDQAPRIVHFAGHGDPDGALILRTDAGDNHTLKFDELRQLFAMQRVRPALVVFATCYSRELAATVAPHVDHAIGFDGPLDDRVAPVFSAVLYERLAAHDPPDVPRAFRLARLAAVSAGYPEVQQACLFGPTGVLA